MAKNEYIKIIKVKRNTKLKLNILISNKNKTHVKKEAIVPGAYFIFPIKKNVKKNKLIFLIIFNN